jgi:Tol biopolymer transport system component
MAKLWRTSLVVVLLAAVMVGILYFAFGIRVYSEKKSKDLGISSYIAFTKSFLVIDTSENNYQYKKFGRPYFYRSYSNVGIIDLRNSKSFLITNSGLAKRPSVNGTKIYYSSGPDFRESIYVVDLKDKIKRKVISEKYYATNPVCSHNGEFLLFEGNPDGARAIMTAKCDGTDARVLTRNTVLCGSPDWSYDDEKVIYDCRTDSVTWALWVMDKNGSNPHPVLLDNGVQYQRPAWQPNKDGWIACQGNKVGIFGIYAIKLGTNGLVKKIVEIVVDGYDNRNPRWSPDGKYIVYQSKRSNGTSLSYDLYCVPFNHDLPQTPKSLTNIGLEEGDPCWLQKFKDPFMENDLGSWLSDGIKLIDTSAAKTEI